MAIYESGEMYLETILILYNKMDNVRAIDICRELNYSKPSVSIALSNLKKEGYVTVDSNGTILFTEAGRSIAEKIFERHKVITNVLVKIGVSPETASEDACKIEHDISDETFEAIKNRMNKE